MDFRKNEEQHLKDNPKLTVGDVTTVNITTINGGIQQNVVPPEITMSVDARMSVTIDHEQFERNIYDWCKQAGPDIEVTFINKLQRIEPTKLDEGNPYWVAFKRVLANNLYVTIQFDLNMEYKRMSLLLFQSTEIKTTNFPWSYR